jgi:hypothetical protein
MRVQRPPTRLVLPIALRSAITRVNHRGSPVPRVLALSASARIRFTTSGERHSVTRHAPNTHMTNRIQHLPDERAEAPNSGEYFVVTGEFGRVFVTREVARHLRTLLTRLFAPRWTSFRDITDSYFTIRTRHVHTIVESTLEIRNAQRQLWRDREKEDEHYSDKPWDRD